MIEIGVIGLLATGLAFRILRMTTGTEAAKPLDRRKFLLHVGGMALLLAYCLVKPLILQGIQDHQARDFRILQDAARAELLNRNGDTAGADALSSRTLQEGLKTFGPRDPRVLDLMRIRARCLAAARRFPDAEAFLLQAQALRTSLSGPDSPDAVLEELALGGLYLEWGRLPEAEAVLRRALGRMDRAVGLVPPSLPIVLSTLAEVCDRSGRAEEARGYRARGQSLSR